MSIDSVLKGERSWHVETCDVLDGLRALPDCSIQCCVTSPPYYGLRDYGVDGQMGLEDTPSDYVDAMVEVFKELRRVLRPDGTFWLNIGDSYNHETKWGGSSSSKNEIKQGYARPTGRRRFDSKPKDRLGIPWQLAFALRSDGWWLRSEVIWHKLAPMPESVSDRPTCAHEQVFLFAKSQKYFYDNVASAEASVCEHPSGNGFKRDSRLSYQDDRGPRGDDESWEPSQTRNMRSIWQADPSPFEMLDWLASRGVDTGLLAELGSEIMGGQTSVWTLSPESFTGPHFATMPTELARRCLLAGTSEQGCCPTCAAPWKRIVEKDRVATRPGTNSKVNRVGVHEDSPYQSHSGDICGNRDPQRHTTTVKTIGWKPGCKCGLETTLPCVVLDPFSGVGTTPMVARRLGLRAIGFELNPEYADKSRQRIRDDRPLFNTG